MITMSKRTTEPAIEYPTPGLTGPADTDDPTIRVSSTPPAYSEHDQLTGTSTAAAPAEHDVPEVLRLADEPRIDTHELVAPTGTIVEVTHNLDTGQRDYQWTDRNVFTPEPA